MVTSKQQNRQPPEMYYKRNRRIVKINKITQTLVTIDKVWAILVSRLRVVIRIGIRLPWLCTLKRLADKHDSGIDSVDWVNWTDGYGFAYVDAESFLVDDAADDCRLCADDRDDFVISTNSNMVLREMLPLSLSIWIIGMLCAEYDDLVIKCGLITLVSMSDVKLSASMSYDRSDTWKG